MFKLNNDEIYLIAMKLNLKDVLTLRLSNKRINKLICDRYIIWFKKLSKDFPNYPRTLKRKNNKETYIFLHGLLQIKKKLNIDFTLEKIFNTEILNLFDKNISEIPQEINILSNLKILYLGFNNLENISKSLCKLPVLSVLYLNSNKIKKIPKEITNLTNLEKLVLIDNEIKEIPKEIYKLSKLKELWLSGNKIEEIPKEIKKSLPDLYLTNNVSLNY